jgi:predicted amidophosphoribosyltransferase
MLLRDQQTVRKYVELLYASQDTIVFDILAKEICKGLQEALPDIRAEFFARLQEKGLLEKYFNKVQELEKQTAFQQNCDNTSIAQTLQQEMENPP